MRRPCLAGVFAAVILWLCSAGAKDKVKATLSADVLQAETVTVVIEPGAGEPLTDPSANRRAREDVEVALSKWGRFRLVMDPQTADLVIAIRRGSVRGTPTIRGGSIDDRPVIIQPGEGSDIRIGAQHGRPPGTSTIDMPQDERPRLGTEVGPVDDAIAVYRGKVLHPLDSAPVWRYVHKNALRPPAMQAVEQFKKAITESEKAAAQGQGKKKP